MIKWTSEIFCAKQALLRSVSDKMLSAAFHKSPESVRKQRQDDTVNMSSAVSDTLSIFLTNTSRIAAVA